jgi:GTP-binding protein
MKVESVELKTMAVRASQYPTDDKPEFLLVGRSNVGKSSFINTLINRKNYARTSATPGKTQTLNFYLINDLFYFVDVPGYGYANVSKAIKETFGKMIESYVKNRENLKLAFLLVDFRHKPTEDDCLMYNFLKYYNVNVCVIATKCDKIIKGEYKKQTELIKSTLKLDENDKFIITSSDKRIGLDDVLNLLDEVVEL